MLLTPTEARALYADALARHYAILAVNADSPAAITDCLEAARQCKAPIIIETSLWQLIGHSFGAGDPLRGMLRYLVQVAALANAEPYQETPVIFHTDHIKGPRTREILTAAIQGLQAELGSSVSVLYPSSVSLDSSDLSEAENIALLCDLCRAAEEAHADVTLEMEAGVDDGLTPTDVTRCLVEAVEAQYPGRLALWAPGLGTKHGLSDAGYPAFSPEAVAIQRELARELTGRPIGIALHGSSGLAESSLREAVAAGVVKVNWSSESLMIRSGSAREYYALNADKLQPGSADFKAAAMDNGVQAFVSRRYIPSVMGRISVLGGEGKAV